MRRIVAVTLLLAFSTEAPATGVDDSPCKTYRLSHTQLERLEARVRAATGFALEEELPYTCAAGFDVRIYSSTKVAVHPDGVEEWYEVHCEFFRLFSTGWKCKYLGQRVMPAAGPWREPIAKIFIPIDSDTKIVRTRLDQAIALLGTLDEQNSCAPADQTEQQLLELRSDLQGLGSTSQVSLNEGRFTFWTRRYAVLFTLASPEAPLTLKCWRPKVSISECLSGNCPA